jgi:hypothetical protein
MDDSVAIPGFALRARLSATEAELVRLQGGSGLDLLWNGDPAFWTGCSPLLFPIVGKAKGNRIKVAGAAYEIGRHGFARTSTFALVSSEAARCVWRLEASEATRWHYPFEFRLDVTYAIEGAALHMTAEVTNRGNGIMPASFGFHPALRWPLPHGKPRAVHEIVFDHDEPAPVRRPVDALLGRYGIRRRCAIVVWRCTTACSTMAPSSSTGSSAAASSTAKRSACRSRACPISGSGRSRGRLRLHRTVAGPCQPREFRR